MDQLLFDRPREKLQLRGVSFLTSTELVQLILGSGSSYGSVAKLSRLVAQLASKGELTSDNLCSIKGIGQAKASQILAAVEFGKRLSVQHNEPKPLLELDINRVMQQAKQMRSAGILIYFFDGSSRIITSNVLVFAQKSSSLHAQHVAQMALQNSARSIGLVLVTKSSNTHLTLDQLDTLKRIKESLNAISITAVKLYKTDGAIIEELNS